LLHICGEARYRHVSRYVGRPAKDGAPRGWQVQIKYAGVLVLLARTADPALGALFAAAARLDPALRTREALTTWFWTMCGDAAAFAAWAATVKA
jgi:hypothetical protein